MANDVPSTKEPESSNSVALTKGMEMMIAGFIPNTRYFDSRFDLLQVQIDLLQKGQAEVKTQILRLEDQVERRFERSDEILKGFKNDVDKRFEKSDQNLNEFKSLVDKRFEQVDKRFEQVDKRFEKSDQSLNEFKTQVDKRFEQVDKRFEQMVASIDRLTEKLDHRDEKQRGFTIRMFSIAVMISFLGALGAMLKVFGII